MFDDDSNLKDNGGQKKPAGGGFNRIPVFTLLAWAGIIAAIVVLFMMRQKGLTPAKAIMPAQFLSLNDSNLIANANVAINQQTLPLVEVTGAFSVQDTNGKVAGETVPFVVHNFILTQDAEDLMNNNPHITITSPNVVVMNLVWEFCRSLFWVFCFGFSLSARSRRRARGP